MYLVTGATGLLGNSVTRELLRRGESVRVLCRPTSDLRSLANLDVEICDGELTDRASVRRSVDGCAAVIHCAAYIHIGWTRLAESRAINVDGTKTVADACQNSGCRLIHVSTVDTLPSARSKTQRLTETCQGRPKTACAYVISKREAEQVVRDGVALGLDAVIVNPGFLLGPFDWKPSSGRMMLQLSRAPVAIAPGGGGSVCDARDVAEAIVNAICKGRSGESYILGGYNISYKDLWTHMLTAMGRQQRAYSFPCAVAAVGRILDGIHRLTNLRERSPNGAEIAMGGLWHYYDSTKAHRELNYRMRELDSTLNDAWQWLKSVHQA